MPAPRPDAEPAATAGAGRPILVTGAPRSGTTWVGRMLALAPGVGYVHEPFNPDIPAGIAGGVFTRHLQYVCAENEAAFRPALARALAFRYDLPAALRAVRGPRDVARIVRDEGRLAGERARRLRPLVKDPIAVFSAEWLAAAFGMDVVVLVRHPAAVVASFKRLGWRHDFRSFLDQPLLMNACLRPYEAEIRAAAAGDLDAVAEATLLWRLVHQTIMGYRDRHPDWLFRRHEDLSRDPLGEFEQLYARLGLELTLEARRGIEAHSAASNPAELEQAHSVKLASSESLRNWSRVLSDAEVARVREAVADVSPAFYGDDDW
ncbi:MAG: sulfotransferase [Gaiellales bacterium]